MKLVMFDIDGTLTRTDVADERCFVRAVGDVLGFGDVNTDWSSYPHCSDSAILEALFLERLRRTPTVDEMREVQSRFVALLAAECREHPFLPIAGAREMLALMGEDEDLAVSLASGAWECSARLKLSSAGLHLSHVPAAFADDAHAREEIIRTSLERAVRAHAGGPFDAVIYVGDGVWDARAARNLGFPFIGIAHDPNKAQRLLDEGARHVLRDYQDTEGFLTRLAEFP